MSGPRFSLRWLFGSISLIAIGCGLLVYARPLTAYTCFAATLLVLFSAIPLSVYRSGARRAFWFGFALFGLGYLGLMCGPWEAPDVQSRAEVREWLPPTKLLRLAYDWVPTKTVTGTPGGMGRGFFGQFGGGAGGPMVTVPITDWSDFVIVGHSLWAIIIAVLGGGIASWYQRTSQRGE